MPCHTVLCHDHDHDHDHDRGASLTCCPECSSTAFSSTPLGENAPPLQRAEVALQRRAQKRSSMKYCLREVVAGARTHTYIHTYMHRWSVSEGCGV